MKQEAPQQRHKPPRESSDLQSEEHVNHTSSPWGDIGYRASASAYSREVLAASFNMQIDDLPNFPFTEKDPFIVTRNNLVDEYAMCER
jgi:hypothetical protein